MRKLYINKNLATGAPPWNPQLKLRLNGTTLSTSHSSTIAYGYAAPGDLLRLYRGYILLESSY